MHTYTLQNCPFETKERALLDHLYEQAQKTIEFMKTHGIEGYRNIGFSVTPNYNTYDGVTYDYAHASVSQTYPSGNTMRIITKSYNPYRDEKADYDECNYEDEE